MNDVMVVRVTARDVGFSVSTVQRWRARASVQSIRILGVWIMKDGVERGIRTLGSHSDIGLAVLRLTRLGHLHLLLPIG